MLQYWLQYRTGWLHQHQKRQSRTQTNLERIQRKTTRGLPSYPDRKYERQPKCRKQTPPGTPNHGSDNSLHHCSQTTYLGFAIGLDTSRTITRQCLGVKHESLWHRLRGTRGPLARSSEFCGLAIAFNHPACLHLLRQMTSAVDSLSPLAPHPVGSANATKIESARPKADSSDSKAESYGKISSRLRIVP